MNHKIELALTAARLAGARETLQTITRGADAKQAGTKAHLLAFIVGCSECETQRQLAARLGVTPGRACQMLAVLRRYVKRGAPTLPPTLPPGIHG